MHAVLRGAFVMRKFWAPICLVVGLAISALVSAQAAEAPATKPSAAKPPATEAGNQPPENRLPPDAVTHHVIRLNGQDFAYTATAGYLTLIDAKGAKTAAVFFVAYTKDGADASAHPLTFAFNGGPGAASAFLHLGALGPRALDFDKFSAPPYTDGKIIDNPDTWLDMTDLVFIDPVGTGYSRPLVEDDKAKKAFWGVVQDLRALGEIIRRALVRLNRFASPVYLAGESYGGYRAARLVRRLVDQDGIEVRGAVLVSPILEFSLAQATIFNPMSWALRLPSYAAVHLEAQGKLSPPALKDVEGFALGEYLVDFVNPPTDPAKREALYQKVADYTGIDRAVVERWRGRIPLPLFVKEIRHGQEQLVSHYDGSAAGDDPFPPNYFPQSGDPLVSGIKAPLTSGLVAYLRDELKFKTARAYRLLSGQVEKEWEWRDPTTRGPTGAGIDLAAGLALDSQTRLLIAHGMTDLQTPYLASRYVVEHLPNAHSREQVSLKLYAGGHMMYLRKASRAQLHEDARAIYSSTTR